MKFLPFLLSLSLATFGLTISNNVCHATTDASQLNVIVILVDDMGWTGLSGYGSDLHRTPNIDQFAERSMKFTNAYASASICTPTRAALLTGKYPARLDMTIWHEMAKRPQQNKKLIPPVVENNLPHSETTIAETLKGAGYKTAHVGKWHLGEASHYPETQGFDFTFGGCFWGCPATFYFPYRGMYGGGSNRHYRYIPGIDSTEDREGEHLTDRLTDEALGFIERASEDPFFLYMSYYTVHTPIEGKPEIADRYAEIIEPGMDHQNAHFAAMHETLDENVGRILEKLENEGMADRTIIILTSDNGGFIGSSEGQVVTSNAPLRSGKGSLYEGGVRVPLIVYWPGVTQTGSVSKEPVATMDLYPTIASILGLSMESQFDGMSLTPLLKDPRSKLDRDTLFWHYPHYYGTTTPVSSIRQGNWKLLEYFEDNRLELYDLNSDIGETKNLADSMPHIAKKLQQSLVDWRKQVNASMPKPNPNWQAER